MLRITAKRGLTAVSGMAHRGLKILGEIKLRKENNIHLGRSHQNPSEKGYRVILETRCANCASHSVSVEAWMKEAYARLSTSSPKSPTYLLIVILEL